MSKKRLKPETLLRDLMETVNGVVVIFDADDRLVMCNARYKSLYSQIEDVLVPGVTSAEIYRHGAREAFSIKRAAQLRGKFRCVSRTT